MSIYSLRKSRQVLREAYTAYRCIGRDLSEPLRQDAESTMERLDDALLRKDRREADDLARQLIAMGKTHLKKPWWRSAMEIGVALIFALILATLIRQMVAENYQIPTGSMRPSFKERDHLVVSKSAFGVNLPLKAEHLYFDDDLVQRTGVFVFRVDDLDIDNPRAKFLWVFPSIKRFIKRIMGKPGDTLYFYGGQIYAFDADGNDLEMLRSGPITDKLEHIPFGRWRELLGQPERNSDNSRSSYAQLFGTPLGRINKSPSRSGNQAELFFNGQWQPEGQEALLSDLWGIGNYAMARLLNGDQLTSAGNTALKRVVANSGSKWFLELRHSPKLSESDWRPVGQGLFYVGLRPKYTAIALEARHIDALWNNLNTARLEVQNGRARRYSSENRHPSWSAAVPLPGVPDGTYEFFAGKAYEVLWGGRSVPVADDHPIYERSDQRLFIFFNFGINAASEEFPARYAYYRNGDLYCMGAPIMDKDDPALQAFVAAEQQRTSNRYRPFIDQGPPLKKDGSLDKEFIAKYGIRIPDGHYLALGDNHAMSQDSRYFGFIPEGNIRGAPTFRFWPSDERGLSMLTLDRPWLTLPNVMVWGFITAALLGTIAYFKKRRQRPVFQRLSG